MEVEKKSSVRFFPSFLFFGQVRTSKGHWEVERNASAIRQRAGVCGEREEEGDHSTTPPHQGHFSRVCRRHSDIYIIIRQREGEQVVDRFDVII